MHTQYMIHSRETQFFKLPVLYHNKTPKLERFLVLQKGPSISRIPIYQFIMVDYVIFRDEKISKECVSLIHSYI